MPQPAHQLVSVFASGSWWLLSRRLAWLRLFGGDAFRRVIYEDLLQKIEEVSAKFVIVGDDFLQDVSI
jgi:hypothetical protein